MKFWLLLPLACWWITSAALTDDCSQYLSRQAAPGGTSIRFTPAFSAWMHNADEEEYIEVLIYMSNGNVSFSRRPEPPAIRVSGAEFSKDEYVHRGRILLTAVHNAKLEFRHSEYISPIHVGAIQVAGKRDAIADLVSRIESHPENLGSLQFMFR